MIAPYTEKQLAKAREAAAACLPGCTPDRIALRVRQPNGRPRKKTDAEIRSAITRAGSPTAAAAVLGIHPTTVGRRVRALASQQAPRRSAKNTNKTNKQ